MYKHPHGWQFPPVSPGNSMSGIVAAPPPWDLKCRAWIFLVSGLSSSSSFPAGFADPAEAEVLASGGKFTGTPGIVMVVSYSETPVGPYDELLYIPGRWRYKNITAGYRITRIYVSSQDSVENGRRNWNIPKHVADFSITTTNEETTIKVSHPGVAEPFFYAKTKPVSFLSKIPIPLNTSILGDFFTLTQLPLRKDPTGNDTEEPGSSQCATVSPSLKGTGYAECIIPQLDGKVGDGKGFPAIVPWSVGLYVPEMRGEFGFATFSDSE